MRAQGFECGIDAWTVSTLRGCVIATASGGACAAGCLCSMVHDLLLPLVDGGTPAVIAVGILLTPA